MLPFKDCYESGMKAVYSNFKILQNDQSRSDLHNNISANDGNVQIVQTIRFSVMGITV